MGLKLMEQVAHIHLALNYVHLFSHLSIVHRHKLAETSLRWGTVYHNNMLPAFFLPLSRSLSFFPLSISLSEAQAACGGVCHLMWLLCCDGGEENSPSLQEHQTLYAWRKAPAEMPALCKESWERNTCRWKEGSKRGFCFRYANVDTTLRLQRGKKTLKLILK